MRNRRWIVAVCGVVAGFAVLPPAAQAAPASVTAPAANAVWYRGETKAITWTTDGLSGSYTLELWSTGNGAARIATIGTGPDVSVGTHRWTMPQTMAPIVAEDVAIKIIPAAGDPLFSSSFDLRASSIRDVNMCDWEHGLWQLCAAQFSVFSTVSGWSTVVYWGANGVAGDQVKIDLVRYQGGSETVYPILKSTPNDGKETVVIPKKAPGDTVFWEPTFKIVVTPLLASASAGSSRMYPNYQFASAALWVDAMAFGPVSAGDAVDINFGGQEVADEPRTYVVTAVPASGEPIVIYTGTRPRMPHFRWRPSVAGTYTIKIADAKSPKKTVSAQNTVTVTARNDVVRQSAPSDTTITTGQPVTFNWRFYTDANDSEANSTYFPVEISVVNAAGKATSLATGITGYVEVREFGDAIQRDGQFIWKPSAKLAPGTYTVKIKRVGTTETSDQTITISNPTSITLAEFDPTTVEPGQQLALDWEISGDSQSTVDITLVRSSGDPTPIAVARKVGGGRGIVTIPKAVAAGSYTLRVATTEKYGTAKTQLSASRPITVTAPTITVTTGANAVKNGQGLTISWDYGLGSTLPVKLELFKGAAAKATLVIAKDAVSAQVDPTSMWWHPPSEDGQGSLTWQVPAQLAAGADYVVKATIIGVKPAVSASSSAFAVSAPTLTVSDSPYEGGVVHGQTVPVTWASDSGVAQNVSVVLVKGSKVVAKFDTKELTSNGSGSYTWTVADKLVAGADYKVRVIDNDVPTRTDDSAAFSIGPNPTTLG